MEYDEYTDISGKEIVPFIDFDDDFKTVYRLVYPVQVAGKEERSQLNLWVEYDGLKKGYYLYLSVVTKEELGVSLIIDGSGQHSKIKLMEADRNTKDGYYHAAIKAAVFARKIVEKLCPELKVDWEDGRATEKLRGKNLSGVSSSLYNEIEYVFVE